jgi:hypothetical protein
MKHFKTVLGILFIATIMVAWLSWSAQRDMKLMELYDNCTMVELADGSYICDDLSR